jgi:benzoate membrane transport protein
VTLSETIGVFIFANALILLCGITGLFARLMTLIPHSLAAAMLAGVLLQFGLHAFAHLDGHFLLCGSMIAAWLLAKALAPRYAIVVTLLAGGLVAWISGDVATDKVSLSVVMPEFIAPDFTFTSLVSIGLPFFLVTMASQNAPGFATMKASGYSLAVSPLIIVTGGLALLLSPLASSPSASRPLPPPSVKALMPTRIRLNAGWRPLQPVGFICWLGFSAGLLPGSWLHCR